MVIVEVLFILVWYLLIVLVIIVLLVVIILNKELVNKKWICWLCVKFKVFLIVVKIFGKVLFVLVVGVV